MSCCIWSSNLSCAVTTVLIQTTTHQLSTTHQVQWDVAPTYFYQGFAGNWHLFLGGYRASHCGSKMRSNPSVCLNHTVFGKYMISKKPYLNLSKYINKLLVVKTLTLQVKILDTLVERYQILWLKILDTLAKNIRHFP